MERVSFNIQLSLVPHGRFVAKNIQNRAKNVVYKFLDDQIEIMSSTKSFVRYYNIIVKVQQRFRGYLRRKQSFIKLVELLWDKNFVSIYYDYKEGEHPVIPLPNGGDLFRSLTAAKPEKKKPVTKKGKPQWGRRMTMALDIIAND